MTMRIRSSVGRRWFGFTCCLLLVAVATALRAQRSPAPAGYFGGVVEGDRGPEAGVWVIAETRGPSAGFIEIVVTDDRARFVIPELPDAEYRVWVRGYGLVDSTPVPIRPGATAVTLRASNARTPGRRARLPRRLLAVARGTSRDDGVSRHGP